jgi:hypothetical protein
MTMDRTAQIAAAKTFLARCLNAIDERCKVHDCRRRVCERVGGEIASWHEERRVFLNRLSATFRFLYQTTGAKPYDFAKRKLEPTADQLRENQEIAQLGMLQWTADIMAKVSDPQEHPIPSIITGSREELAMHLAHFAGVKIHEAVVGKPTSEQLSILQRLNKSDEDPIVRDISGAFRQVLNHFPNVGAERICAMYVSGLPPIQAAAAIAANQADADRDAPPSALNPAPAAGNTQPAAAVGGAIPADLQTYQGEWRAMSAEDRGGWIDFETFARFRKHEDRGQVTLVKVQTGSSNPQVPAAAAQQTPSATSSDADQLAAAEWDQMPAAQRANWISKDVYVTTRAIELRRQARSR